VDYKFKKENYEFWLERLKTNSPNQVCTNDIGLDVLESQQILSKISDNKSVLEIGCGNGLLYEDLRKSFDLSKYVGTDFVDELVKECDSKKIDKRDVFMQLDMTEVDSNTFNSKFDFIVSKRAVQNVLDHKHQIEAIDKFGYFLDENGLMVLVESSNDAQQKINSERKKYGLNEINAPFHNLFFDDDLIRNHNFKNVRLQSIESFASDFYFITRIVYARYATEYLNEDPNYDHPLQKIALTMSNNQITRDFSQIKCYTFVKK
jgi:cyclopropane fatty-acyl-phospholipid synthase-like methyltransferase